MDEKHCRRAIILPLAVLAVLALVSSPRVVVAQYSVRDLGTLGGNASYAYDLNYYGHVVGYSYTSSGEKRAFLWQEDEMTNLGVLADGTESAAYGINDSDQVVGVADPAWGGNRAFLWDAGVKTVLGTLGDESGARGISKSGGVAGSADDPSGYSRVFLWVDPGRYLLGTLGGDHSYGWGIDNANRVVGRSLTGEIDPLGNPVEHAFLWQEGVGMIDLGTLPGGSHSRAWGIDNFGQVVGEATVSTDVVHAFAWRDDVMTDLGTLGGTNSAAYGTGSRDGQVVGASDTGSGERHAFIWIPAGGMADLNTLIAPIERERWDLIEARAINDLGQIVGWGLVYGEMHAFLLTPESSAKCFSARPDDRCLYYGGGRRGEDFPPAGIDDFPSGASFKVKFLDGYEVQITGMEDQHTIVGRSDPHYHGDPADDATVIFSGGVEPYPNTAVLAGDPCVIPADYPESPLFGHEIHTQILALDLTDGNGNWIKAGQPFYDSVALEGRTAFYRNSFGEVQGLDHDFPGDSIFNVFVEVSAAGQKYYNKTPMLLRARLDQFPPDLTLPTSVYLHDPSFGAVPLFDVDGIHVAYLLSAGHGAVDTPPQPEECQVQTSLSSPVSFVLDNLGTGPRPTEESPNHAIDDNSLPAQQLTTYTASGQDFGHSPDLTNARIPGLVGSTGFAVGDAINSVSFGRDGTRDTGGWTTAGTILFSVGRASLGEPCTSIRLASETSQPDQAADIYVGANPSSPLGFGGYGGSYLPEGRPYTNSLMADQTVVGLRPEALGIGQDNLTGIELAQFAPVNDRLFATFAGPTFGCDYANDCNGNGIGDLCDISFGTSLDCNDNGIPDECDIAAATSPDLDGNGVPDECEPDCNANGLPDAMDIAGGTSIDCNNDGMPDECDGPDCNSNGVLDECDISAGTGTDCNANSILDECEIASGSSADSNDNGIPDECEDCNANGVPDEFDVAGATSEDENGNGIPDECEDCNGNGILDSEDVVGTNGSADCNGNLVPDECELASGSSSDCNTNLILDECDVALATSQDVDGNGIPDECQADCNTNGIPDEYDIATAASQDCNLNGIPDECDIATGFSHDCNTNAVPDECETDCNKNGIHDDCDIASGTSADYDGSGVPDECERRTAFVFVFDDDVGDGSFAPGNLAVFAHAAQMGLTKDDVIDALAVSDETPGEPRVPNGVLDLELDQVLFSLAPGSPSLVGYSPADVFISSFDGAFQRYASAAELGLLDTDDLDALDVGPTLAIEDCNCDGVDDACNIAGADPVSQDCNLNGIPDECERAGNDCNCNNVPDECDLFSGKDCNYNSIPDECEIDRDSPALGEFFCTQDCAADCNDTGVPDECEIFLGTSADCDLNSVPDECFVPVSVFSDSFPGTVLDPQNWSVAFGATVDDVGINEPSAAYSLRLNGYQDYVESVVVNLANCQYAELTYYWQRTGGGDPPESGDDLRIEFRDAWGNWAILKEHSGGGMRMFTYQQETVPLPAEACHANFALRLGNTAVGGVGWDDWFVDDVEISAQIPDCNGNAVPDECDISGGTSQDSDGNGIPDECEDCNTNGWPDDDELAQGAGEDCNDNRVLDECDIAQGTSFDCDFDGVPDECVLAQVFQDGFADVALAPANWSVVSGATVDDVGINEPSSPYSLRLNGNGDGTGPSGGDRVESVAIALADYEDAMLSFSWQRTGGGDSTEVNDDLSIDFRDASGAWINLTRYPGSGADMNDYAQEAIALPPEAHHAGFVLSISNSASSGPYDDWFVDDVEIVAHLRAADCNANGTPDECDLALGTSQDSNGNGIPDECDPDCNTNGVPDDLDISGGTSLDCNNNDIPDECDPDCNNNGTPDDCDVVGGTSPDCNSNGIPDECDIASTTSQDLNNNSIPDECDPDCNNNGVPDDLDISGGTSLDCNLNSVPDECDIASTTSQDTNSNGIPDECDPDCNNNGVPDDLDISGSTSLDCNLNSVPDECDIASTTSQDLNNNNIPDECDPDCNNNSVPDDLDLSGGTSLDCNLNSVPDECDIASTTSQDLNNNGIPDECDPDCNNNGVPDDLDISGSTSLDCNLNSVPDECDIASTTSQDANSNGIPDECDPDCNNNSVPDDLDLSGGTSLDCNLNSVPDECDIASTTSQDLNNNSIPDECDPDCNNNGVPDDLDISGSTSPDCNLNSIPDECDIASTTSQDTNSNGIPDECDPDCNNNGVPDDLDISGSTSLDCNLNSVPDECDLCGDNDGDGNVDLDDFATFASCMTGPGGSASASCLCKLDVDDDGDLDLADFVGFQKCFGG
ncbi:MAG: hypothetical protein KAV82_13585 [Phycisphaerae bacterium]|nr:hypothetical protein [Phycisphaerae bacterium]